MGPVDLDNSARFASLGPFGKKLDIFGTPEQKPGKRTPEEVRELKRVIGLIARVFSKTYDLGVYPSPQGGWCCSIDDEHLEIINEYLTGKLDSLDALPPDALKPKKMYYDVSDIEGEMADDEVIGVTRHEIGHVNHSDFRLLLEGQRFAMDEGYLSTSWAGISNALEDPRVNNLEIAGSDVVRDKMTKLYRKWTAETVSKITTQPVTHQLGLALIYYWLTEKEMPGISDKKVLDAFEKIKPHADRYFLSDDAGEAHEILRTDIWPIYKTLEQKALSDEQMKELMRKISGSSLGDSKRQLGTGGGSGDVMAQIAGQIKKILDGAKRGKKSPGDDMGNSVGGDVGARVADEMKRQEKNCANRDEDLEKRNKATGLVPDDISLEDVDSDLLKELQKAIDGLSREQKKQLEKDAREQLDTKQAQSVNTKNPKIIQMEKDPDSGLHIPKIKGVDKAKAKKIEDQVDAFNELLNRQKAQEDAAAEEVAAARAAAEEEAKRKATELADMIRQGFDANDLDLYRAFRQMEREMEGYIASFMKLLDQYLPKKDEVQYDGEFYSGKKVNKKAVVRRAPVNDSRFFKRRNVVESPDPKMFVTLLIDKTTSMQGQKMRESLKTAVFLARVLQRFNIPFAISFFGAKPDSVMELGQDYDDPKHGIKPALMRKGVATDGSTDLATPLEATIKTMTDARRMYPGCHGGIFVISDSGANAGPRTGAALGEWIREQQKRYTIVNLLLSKNMSDRNEANTLFGEQNVVQSEDFTDLPKQAFNVLRVLLIRILKTYKST